MENTIVLEGVQGLRTRQGFVSHGKEMTYIGNGIGKDMKGNKYKIVSTTLSQSDEDRKRGVRVRFYQTKKLG